MRVELALHRGGNGLVNAPMFAALRARVLSAELIYLRFWYTDRRDPRTIHVPCRDRCRSTNHPHFQPPLRPVAAQKPLGNGAIP